VRGLLTIEEKLRRARKGHDSGRITQLVYPGIRNQIDDEEKRRPFS
jgi:hypothetical protein